MEQGAGSQESVYLPEPASTRRADFHGQDGLEGHAQKGGRTAFPDLYPAARLLYSVEWRRSRRCCAARDAAHKPGDQASLPARYDGPSAASR